MPSINMRQLRDTKRLKSWLRAGKTVELRDRERVIGHIVPDKPVDAPQEMPDFEARAKMTFGDRILPNLVIEARKRARY